MAKALFSTGLTLSKLKRSRQVYYCPKISQVNQFGNPRINLKRSQLKSGDFLFSIAGSIGTCAVVTEQILASKHRNQALAIIRGANWLFLLGYFPTLRSL